MSSPNHPSELPAARRRAIHLPLPRLCRQAPASNRATTPRPHRTTTPRLHRPSRPFPPPYPYSGEPTRIARIRRKPGHRRPHLPWTPTTTRGTDAGHGPPAGGGSAVAVSRRRHASDPSALMAMLVCPDDPREGRTTAPALICSTAGDKEVRAAPSPLPSRARRGPSGRQEPTGIALTSSLIYCGDKNLPPCVCSSLSGFGQRKQLPRGQFSTQIWFWTIHINCR